MGQAFYRTRKNCPGTFEIGNNNGVAAPTIGDHGPCAEGATSMFPLYSMTTLVPIRRMAMRIPGSPWVPLDDALRASFPQIRRARLTPLSWAILSNGCRRLGLFIDLERRAPQMRVKSVTRVTAFASHSN
jgi:hypothetical protein